MYVCDTVCVGDGANLPAVSGSVWFVQKQSHDLHHQPQHCQKKVSLHGNWAPAQIWTGLHVNVGRASVKCGWGLIQQ